MISKQEALKTFYNTLPEDVYIKCIINMKEPKTKEKTISNFKNALHPRQVEIIVKNEKYQLAFTKELCKCYRLQFNANNYHNMKIEDVIQSINLRNFHSAITYMICCCEYYNNPIFENYILSTDFKEFIDKILSSNVFEEDKENNITQDLVTISKGLETIAHIQPLVLNTKRKIKEVKGMNKYLSRIEKSYNEFYFIEPLFLIDSFALEDIPDIFGSTGKLKISAPNQLLSEKFETYKFCIAEIDDRDIYEPPADSDGCVKAQIYENKIIRYEPDDDRLIEKLFEIVKIQDDINNFKCKSERILPISFAPLSRKIYLESSNYLYGPFAWNYNNNGYEIRMVGTSQNVFQWNISQFSNNIYFIPSKLYGENSRKILFCQLNASDTIIDFIDNNSLKDLVAKKIATGRSEKTDIRKKLNELEEIDFSEDRKLRVLQLFNDGDAIDETLDVIIQEMLKSEVQSNQIVEKIIDTDIYFKQIESKLGVNEKIQELRQEEKHLTEDIDISISKLSELKEKYNSEKAQQKKEMYKQVEEENVKLEEEKNKLLEDISLLGQKYSKINTIRELEEKARRAEIKCELAEERKRDIEDKTRDFETKKKEIENNLTSTIQEKIKGAYADVSLNGLIASRIMEEARKYERSNEDNKNRIVSTQSSLSNCFKAKDKEELINFVYSKFEGKRNLKKNDIINILLCLSHGFITVFAGSPGTGKTSLCEMLSKILGLSRKDEHNRYIEISVEKGWTSKRDFIGYYNPLSKSFDRTNRQLFEAFSTLNQEAIQNVIDFPFLITLDEANLSPMEYYWADFMNVCDFNKENRHILLGEDDFQIPETLRFLATINYDHTTEILSPRLIDRAWIILLESSNENIQDIEDCDISVSENMFSYRNFTEILKFGVETKNDSNDEVNVLPTEIIKKFNEISNLFRSNNISISPRTINMIKKYCVVGIDLFEGENSYISLDYAIAQKVLPLINGYGDQYKNFLEQLQDLCKNAMPKCYFILDKIIKNGNINMQYYQFFMK